MLISVKTIKTHPEDIQARIQRKIHEHIQQFYDPPTAILLGPNEYLDLMLACERGKLSPVFMNFADMYMGYPVRVKRSNGIDLEINPRHVTRFAKGSVKSE